MPAIRSLASARGGAAALAFGLALALLAACTSGSPASSPSPATQLGAATAHWASFPAGAATRPLVVEAGADVSGARGFTSGAAKIAFVAGAISLPRSLPAGPSSRAGFPLISAARAAAVLTARHASGMTPSTRLAVTRVKLGFGAFDTDRGQQVLPAWQFTIRGVAGTVNVLAVAAPARFWPSGLKQVSTGISAAQAGRSGRALTVTVQGAQAGTGPCQATYSVRQQSSAHAVALDVVARLHSSGQGGCASVGYRVTLPVTLSAPLGNRVLVDARSSAPIPVTQPLVSSS
ncbi:MAG TPA: hypothetical protein VGJ19_05495 [Streptosporangiaceae bacterium]